MPYNDPDPTDPMTLNGVVIETDAATADETTRAMAACFAEEFVRMGYEPERILFLFESPVYHGAHMAYQALGAEVITETIARAMRTWRPHYASPAAESD